MFHLSAKKKQSCSLRCTDTAAAIFVWVSGFLHFYVSCLQSVTATVTHLTVTTTLKWIRREEVWMSTVTTEGEESVSTVR